MKRLTTIEWFRAAIRLSLLACAYSSSAIAQQAKVSNLASSYKGWPAPPNAGKLFYMFSEPVGNKELDWFQILPPIFQSPDADPIQNITTSPLVEGTLVYTPYTLVPPAGQKYFIMRSFGSRSSNKPKIAAYNQQSIAQSFDPFLSRDGRYLFFKNGSFGDRYSRYGLYVWDFSKGTAKTVSEGITGTFHYISPDSGYVASIFKGISQSLDWWPKTAPVDILLHNVKTGKERILSDVAAPRDVVWTQQGTLLYTAMPPLAKNIKLTGTNYPSIYEFNPKTGKSRKIIAGAYDPSPSADGRNIAFFGWPMEGGKPKLRDKEGKEISAALYIASSKANAKRNDARWLLSNQTSGQVLWDEANKQLVVLTSKNVGGTKTELTVSLTSLSVIQHQRPLVNLALLTADDFTTINRDSSTPPFRGITVARNGRYVVIDVSEYIGQTTYEYTERKTLLAIGLSGGEKGKLTTIARLTNERGSVIGWDWRDESEVKAISPLVKKAKPAIKQ